MNALLLAGSGPLNLKVVYCLARIPATTHVVATSPDNIVRNSRHVSSFAVSPGVSDLAAPDATVAWLRDYCTSRSIDVVIPGDIGTAGFLAEAAPHLRGVAVFPCSTHEMLDRIHDKWLFASTLMRAGIATPTTVLIESEADVPAASRDVGFPLMVKPLSGEASHGVVRIESEAALLHHVLSGRQYTRPPLVAQRFIGGRDIDISVLADRGRVVLGVTQQLEPDGSLRFFPNAETRRLAESVVSEYGYHGIAHFDMRVDEDSGKVFVLECNPRFWYSMPASMWQGVNFVEAGIRLARGEKVPDERELCAGRYFLPGALLAALRHPVTLHGLTSRNLRGVLQPAMDPVPHLLDLYRKSRARH